LLALVEFDFSRLTAIQSKQLTALLVPDYSPRCGYLLSSLWLMLCQQITLLQFTAFCKSIFTLKLSPKTRQLDDKKLGYSFFFFESWVIFRKKMKVAKLRDFFLKSGVLSSFESSIGIRFLKQGHYHHHGCLFLKKHVAIFINITTDALFL
jgi:hypothetical protein